MLIALDINSNRTGVAFGAESDSGPRCIDWPLPGGEDLPRCAGILAATLTETAKLLHPTIVAIETPVMALHFQASARALFVLLSLYGAATAAAHNAGAKVINGDISTWRRHFIGHGRLPGPRAKQLAYQRCEQLGWTIKNHDQAEAAGLWCWAMSTHFPKWSPRGTPLFGRAAA